MAVEIREIVIKAIVSDSDQSETANGQPIGNTNDSQRIVQECVHQVLKILKKKNLR